MKKTHVVIIIALAALVAIVVGVLSDRTTSEPFDVVFANPGKTFKVKGTVDKAQGIQYDPEVDANLCVFYVTDTLGRTEKVIYRNPEDPRPQGLEQSEEIDLYGKAVDGEFHSKKVLLKCPSKYDEEKHEFETAGN